MADNEKRPRVVTRGARTPSDGTAFRLVPRAGATDHKFGERRARWSLDLLQLIGLAIGVALLVHALALLMRAGFESWDLFDPHVEVGGLHGTRLLAGLEALGGLIIVYASIGEIAQGALRVVGFASAIAGAVLLIEPSSVHEWVGVHEENGLVALGVGAALVLASLTPVVNVYPKPPPVAPAPWERSRH